MMRMSLPDFETLDDDVQREGLAAFDRLAARFIEENNYPGLFEARLMKKRLELGVPAMAANPADFPEAVREAYDKAQLAAARETGELFLRDGEIYKAWPYFRAISEPGPVRQAIEALRFEPGDERVDAIVEIAFHEGLHPRKGFELILEHYGTCRAITNFSHYPSDDGRDESAQALIDQLYGELTANLRRAIEKVEGAALNTNKVAELIAERDWLFEGLNYYVDSSHVSSVVQMSLEWEDEGCLKKALEMTEYGKRLAEMYQFKGDPPFENLYEDSGIYLRALLGESQDDAVMHFQAKLPEEVDPFGDPAAQALVKLLVRLERYGEAADVFAERLADIEPQFLQCPSELELRQLSGDYDKMAEAAKRAGDPLAYVAALAQGSALTGKLAGAAKG